MPDTRNPRVSRRCSQSVAAGASAGSNPTSGGAGATCPMERSCPPAGWGSLRGGVGRRWAVPYRGPDRGGRHRRGARGARRGRARGGGQGPALAPGAAPARARAVPAGDGADPQPGGAGHRAGPRVVRARRAAVLHHGAAARDHSGQAPARRGARARGGAADRARDLPGVASAACRPGRAPRPEAGERIPDPRRSEAARLRALKSVGDAQLTASSRVLGTPGYIAPEVWEGDPADARADLYAVGAILFEMLAGTKAF